jgi:hypothetical protein
LKYIFIGLLLVFLLYPIISAKTQLNDDNKKKALTSVTALMSLAIFMSIVFSVVIALNADMPASIGHGGFMYIIGPSFYGLLVLIFYLVSLGVRPDFKFALGIISILINLLIGCIYFLN